MIQLGEKVRDTVTGFEGIAVARLEYLNGCVQYCVQPPAKDNKVEEGTWVDEAQLQAVGVGVTVAKRGTGGPVPNAPTAYRG